VKSVCLAAAAGGALRHPARPEPARDGAGKSRHAHERGREKAAALPPKLTVPMILFFLPVLFVVILGPTGIKVAAMQ